MKRKRDFDALNRHTEEMQLQCRELLAEQLNAIDPFVTWLLDLHHQQQGAPVDPRPNDDPIVRFLKTFEGVSHVRMRWLNMIGGTLAVTITYRRVSGLMYRFDRTTWVSQFQAWYGSLALAGYAPPGTLALWMVQPLAIHMSPALLERIRREVAT